ncbi:MAG: permease-like cell division protein FtsX [Nitrospiria bacterium]
MRIVVFLQEAVNNVNRHRLLSFATTITISLILMVFGLFLLIYFNLRGLGGSLREQVVMTAYLQEGLTHEEVRDIEERIHQEPAVGTVYFTSKEEALQEFQVKLQGQAGILQGLGENPLPASFDIKLGPTYQTPEVVKRLAESLKLIKGVEEVQDGLDWLDRFTSFTRFARIMGLGIGVLLGIAVVTITSNTIRLSFYTRREEIELMRLIGAKEAFIRAPFFIEGAVVGLSGGVIALLSVGCLFFLFQKQFIIEKVFFGKEAPLTFFSFELLLLLLFMATFLGGMGGYFSVSSSVKARRGPRSLW